MRGRLISIICVSLVLISVIFPISAFASNSNSPKDIDPGSHIKASRAFISDEVFRERMAKQYGPEVAQKVQRVTTSFPNPRGVSAYTSTTNPIWGGYVLDAHSSSTNIYDVTSTFNARYCYVQIPGTSVYDFEWSGIGGYGNSALLQAGVDMLNHYSFTEALPSETVAQLHFPVSVGDVINTAVYYVSSTTWFVSVYDETSVVLQQ